MTHVPPPETDSIDRRALAVVILGTLVVAASIIVAFLALPTLIVWGQWP